MFLKGKEQPAFSEEGSDRLSVTWEGKGSTAFIGEGKNTTGRKTNIFTAGRQVMGTSEQYN